MGWEEFRALLGGIGPDTPLGRVVAIRAEQDEEVLKHFTLEQHKVRDDWMLRHAKQMSEDEYMRGMQSIWNAFAGMAGGMKH